jgi:DNA-nicking Smr family endonuclease
MAKCFQESQEAYNRRNGALAKQLSNEGREHQRKMEECNKQASNWIFRENNKASAPDEIDLHGLYVKEAIARADEAITLAKRENRTALRLIVGKGLHSQRGVAKIKPAVEELMEKHHLKAELDPQNAGVLVVEIEAPSDRRGLGVEISRRLERKEEGCILM